MRKHALRDKAGHFTDFLGFVNRRVVAAKALAHQPDARHARIELQVNVDANVRLSGAL